FSLSLPFSSPSANHPKKQKKTSEPAPSLFLSSFKSQPQPPTPDNHTSTVHPSPRHNHPSPSWCHQPHSYQYPKLYHMILLLLLLMPLEIFQINLYCLNMHLLEFHDAFSYLVPLKKKKQIWLKPKSRKNAFSNFILKKELGGKNQNRESGYDY
ncbi:unnamed protein product, partial [Prunus brigantina]